MPQSEQQDTASLFRRDLTRLRQELELFPEDGAALWKTLPGVANSAGNLMLHLEGNLREFVGRQMGGVDYARNRDLEFSSTGVSHSALAGRLSALADLIPRVIESLSGEFLDAQCATQHLGVPMTNRQFLMHLYGHFSYHLGQIDYLRRILTAGAAVRFAGL